MNTSPITIEDGRVIIRSATNGIWLTQHEIARLFSVFVPAVGGNIRSMLKTGILREETVCRKVRNKTGGILTLYNLEMITALAFRLKSCEAEQFRRWIVGQAIIPVMLWKIPGMETLLN